MTKKSIFLLALTALGQFWVTKQMQARRQRVLHGHSLTKVKPGRLQTWEGEGGALPVTGAQLGPEPSVKPPHPPAGQDS